MSEMTPSDFYYGFVKQDYYDWKSDRSSVRKAFHVATSAVHLADHYFRYHRKRDLGFAAGYPTDETKGLQRFQDEIIAECPAFKLIQDVTNTLKHLYPRARCDISSAGSIEGIETDDCAIEANWLNGNGDVVVRLRNSSSVSFGEAIEAVIKMWSKRIYE